MEVKSEVVGPSVIAERYFRAISFRTIEFKSNFHNEKILISWVEKEDKSAVDFSELKTTVNKPQMKKEAKELKKEAKSGG